MKVIAVSYIIDAHLRLYNKVVFHIHIRMLHISRDSLMIFRDNNIVGRYISRRLANNGKHVSQPVSCVKISTTLSLNTAKIKTAPILSLATVLTHKSINTFIWKVNADVFGLMLLLRGAH